MINGYFIKKRLTAMLIALVIILGNTITVSAVEFPDIPKDSLFYDAAEYLKQEKILFGYSNGNFYPMENLTGGTFGTAVYRILYPGESLPIPDDGESSSIACLNYLKAENIITEPELEMLSTGSVTWQIIWRVLLPQFGIYPYPHELYPEYNTILICDNVYADVQVAAVETGLADIDTPCNVRPTRGEFALFLYKLMTGEYEPLTSKVLDGIPQSLSNFSEKNWQGRNAVLRAFPNLPAWLVNHFIENGWTIQYEGLYEDHPDFLYATGLTSYSSKHIYIESCSEDSVYHEFGHYLSYILDLDDKEAVCFQEEGNAAKSLLGDYSMTNSLEYFADAFAYWINPDNDRDLLIAVAPKTANLLKTSLVGYTS